MSTIQEPLIDPVQEIIVDTSENNQIVEDKNAISSVVNDSTVVNVDSTTQPLVDSTPVPWYKKNYIKAFFAASSIPGATFNLCSATIGAGALSLANAFKLGGWGSSILLLLFGALVSIFTIYLLVLARKASGFNSFESISIHLFGRWTLYLLYFGLLCFCIGTAIGYVIAVRDIFEDILTFDILPECISNKYILTSIFWLIFMLPLCLLKNMDNLRFTSFSGLLCITYIVCTVVTMAIQNFDLEQFKSLSVVNWNLDLIRAIPLMLFAFSCQINVYEIESTLSGNQEKRMVKAGYFAMFISSIAYIAVGFAGYIRFGENIKGNILLNMIDSKEPYVIATFFVMIYVIIIAFPLNIFPARFTIISMIWGIEVAESKENTTVSIIRHYVLSVIISGIVLVCGLLIQDLSTVFQFIGSVASTMICFAYPAIMCIYLKKKGQLEMSLGLTIASWCLLIGSIIVGIVSLVTIFI